MLDKVLSALKDYIYNYLLTLPELNITSEKVIYLTPIVKFDGTSAIPDNSLGMTLVNIEEERVIKSQIGTIRESNGQISYVNPEIKLNLYVLISANYSTYETGIQFLSGAIQSFQAKSVFTPENTPLLDSTVKKILVELFTLNLEQQNHLWGALGAKYLPSVLYRLRLVVVQEALKSDEQPPVSEVGIDEKEY